MRAIARIALATCIISLVLAEAALAQGERKAQSKSGPKAAGVLAADRGKFQVLFDGQPVGEEEFSVSPSGSEWISRGSVEIKIPGGGSAQVDAELRTSADGTPRSYRWSSAGQKKASGTIQFEGTSAKMELKAEGGQPFVQEFQFETARVVVLDNNLYHQYGLLARLYDWNAKGTQTFAVLIPQDLTPGTVTVEWGGPQEIEGQKLELLKVRSADLELELYVGGGRLMRLFVPGAKVEVKRE